MTRLRQLAWSISQVSLLHCLGAAGTGTGGGVTVDSQAAVSTGVLGRAAAKGLGWGHAARGQEVTQDSAAAAGGVLCLWTGMLRRVQEAGGVAVPHCSLQRLPCTTKEPSGFSHPGVLATLPVNWVMEFAMTPAGLAAQKTAGRAEVRRLESTVARMEAELHQLGLEGETACLFCRHRGRPCWSS